MPSAAQDAAVTAALRAQLGTLHEVALYGNGVTVPGTAGNVLAQAFGGDAAWTGYGIIAGRWYSSAPGQVLTMVVCWIAVPAVVGAAIAAPAAVALNTATVHAMAGTAHTGIPASFTQVFPPSRLALLSLAALAIAIAGALLPASWAVRARPAVALHAE
jgi:hypothetical protein